MMEFIVVYGIQFFLFSISVPLALKKIKPNYLVGVRTDATLGSEEIWYAVNQKTGITIFLISLITIFLLLFFKADFMPYISVISVLVQVVFLIYFSTLASRMRQKFLDKKNEQDNHL